MFGKRESGLTASRADYVYERQAVCLRLLILFRGREDRIQPIWCCLGSLQMRVTHPAVVVERDRDKLIATFKQKFDRILTFLGSEDRFPQACGSVLLIVDGLQLHIRRYAGFEGHTVPPHVIKAAVRIRTGFCFYGEAQ
jgi:hypothetical protein